MPSASTACASAGKAASGSGLRPLSTRVDADGVDLAASGVATRQGLTPASSTPPAPPRSRAGWRPPPCPRRGWRRGRPRPAIGSTPEAAIAPSSTALSGLFASRGDGREVGDDRRGARSGVATSSMRACVEPAVAHGRLLVDGEHARRRGDQHRAVGRDEAGLDGPRRLQQLARDHQVDLAGRGVERQHGARARGCAWRAPRRARSRGSRWWRRCAGRRPESRCPARSGRWRWPPRCSQDASTPPPSPPSAAIRSRDGLGLAPSAHSAGTSAGAALRAAAEQAHQRRRQRAASAGPSASGSG